MIINTRHNIMCNDKKISFNIDQKLASIHWRVPCTSYIMIMIALKIINYNIIINI